ncbi:ABC transporter ATP-binding protein [Citreimonas salinaria]|uniref:Iron complex transport system ATP-binding protein n=1 Tax=Citreimonas salinaria TaxID=321339 RepID=A0A1H3KVH9_9RHOB|nr:ABC transporter ATP-binding protein [Citreimonas salinaria]SDY56100.1 iron complex transport system ATP-binding protein [Citreimonas salinaria]
MADALARLRAVTARYDGVTALDLIDLDLPEGRITALCGPNGSGKSTALRVLRGLHQAEQGEVEVAGRPLRDWAPKDLAKAVAMLSQSPDAPPELTVQDLVRLGRFAHRKRFAGQSGEDHAACARAMRATEMTDLAARPIGRLSGGQLQRAWIAMTIAQDAPRIFLDEPTNHLDVAHAFEVLELVRRLNRTEGRSVVLVLHDLNMAMRYADHVVLFDKGRAVASGPTREVLNEPQITQVFGIRCRIVHVSGEDAPTLVTLPR